MPGHIVAMGAALIDRREPLHDYVLELSGKDDPVVLFLPTATGDDAGYIVSFYEAFHSGRCRPRHLRLFQRDHDDLAEIILAPTSSTSAAATPPTCSTCGGVTAWTPCCTARWPAAPC